MADLKPENIVFVEDGKQARLVRLPAPGKKEPEHDWQFEDLPNMAAFERLFGKGGTMSPEYWETQILLAKRRRRAFLYRVGSRISYALMVIFALCTLGIHFLPESKGLLGWFIVGTAILGGVLELFASALHEDYLLK